MKLGIAAFARIALQDHVETIDILMATAAFGVAFYIELCDVLLSGLAACLTKQRGEKWTKEMDYVYLVLGRCRTVWHD